MREKTDCLYYYALLPNDDVGWKNIFDLDVYLHIIIQSFIYMILPSDVALRCIYTIRVVPKKETQEQVRSRKITREGPCLYLRTLSGCS